MQTYPRPEEETIYVQRQPVPGACSNCGAQELRSYPVLSEGGWWDVVKCQVCLSSEERAPGPLLGGIKRISDEG